MDTRSSGTSWRRFVPGAEEQTAAAIEPAQPVAPPAPEAALIAAGVEMNGKLMSPQSLRIEGEFRGELESKGNVFVSESGSVEAPIKARAVEIHGAVVGNVVASREVVIHATGRLHGDVETPCLVIARGAYFNGRTRMYRPERTRQSEAPDPAPPLG